jgi:hypothetical protein
MKPNFEPLMAPARTSASLETASRVNLAADRKTATSFRPLSDGLLPAAPPAALRGEPKVSLERDGDRVTRITVQCPCGHSVELTCEY